MNTKSKNSLRDQVPLKTEHHYLHASHSHKLESPVLYSSSLNSRNNRKQPSSQLGAMSSSIIIIIISVLLFLSVSSSSSSACDWCAQPTTASFFSSPGPLKVGACGYGAMATQLYNGYIAAASPELFREGDSCGSCFEVRCTDEGLCKKEGVKILVTDKSRTNHSGFVLSKEAFMALGHDGMAPDLTQRRSLDVQFRRIPCEHNKNLSIRVEERSRKPGHLTIKFLYQGGQTDIMAVEVAQVGSLVWQYMSQRMGPIWSTPRAPQGPLRFRLVVTGGYDGKWVWTEEEVLPANWKIGELYDAKVQIKDIAQESCCPDNSYRERWR